MTTFRSINKMQRTFVQSNWIDGLEEDWSTFVQKKLYAFYLELKYFLKVELTQDSWWLNETQNRKKYNALRPLINSIAVSRIKLYYK